MTKRNASSTARGNGCARYRAGRRPRGPAVRRCPSTSAGAASSRPMSRHRPPFPGGRDRGRRRGVFRGPEVPILEGRPFDDAIDTSGAPPVAVVNEALARRFWPGGSAIGRRIRPAGADSSRPTVEMMVGVARNYKVRFLQEPPTPYVHFAASPESGQPCCPPRCCSRAPRAMPARLAQPCSESCGR